MKRETYAEIAKRIDEKVARGEEGVGLVRVPGTVRKNADSIYSIRFTRDEIALLRKRAEEKGVKLSDFVRDAALRAAHRADDDRPEVVRAVQAQVKALAEAVDRL